MGLPFKTAEQLAEYFGYGDLYRASKENEMKGNEISENIKNMMKRVDNVK